MLFVLTKQVFTGYNCDLEEEIAFPSITIRGESPLQGFLQLRYLDDSAYVADGNATVIQTATGTWQIEYNAENRLVRRTNTATGTVITMTFDSQGRCPEYKSVSNFRKTRSCAFFSEINREAKIL